MKKRKKPQPEFSIICLEVTSYRASMDSGINHEVHDKRVADRNTKVFSFSTRLEIKARCTYPEENVGTTYCLNICSGSREEEKLSTKMDDYHVIDDKWQPVYKKSSKGPVPVYNLPKGVGHLEHQRSASSWTGWVTLSRQTVSDMLALLPHVRPLYISFYQFPAGKRFYDINHFSLQTSNPAEE